MREITLESVQDQGKINYIENPLPLPKKHERKEMDYAVEVDPEDDYDLKDMTGMDFFDIE